MTGRRDVQRKRKLARRAAVRERRRPGWEDWPYHQLREIAARSRQRRELFYEALASLAPGGAEA